MVNVKYIKLVSSDYKTYKIDKDNLLEYNCVIKKGRVDVDNFPNDYNDEKYTIPNSVKNYISLPLVSNLLLVIKDYHKVVNENGEIFDENKKDISYIFAENEDGYVESAYVNLTSENSNDFQMNCIDENGRLYITIDEEI